MTAIAWHKKNNMLCHLLKQRRNIHLDSYDGTAAVSDVLL